MALYDYQERGIAAIRSAYARGVNKVLFHLATGGGKTHVFCEILKGLHSKGNPGIVVVRGRKLVDQASKRLEREGVPHGVFMAGHKRYAPNFPIQVCSIDTLRARGLLPRASLIVVDEAHFAVSKSFKNFLSCYPDALILSVTATPYTKQPLRHLGDVIISPVTISDLLSRGFLVDGRFFAPRTPKLDQVDVSRATGDYDIEQLNEVMKESVLVGDIVSEWIRLAEQKSTLVFCCTVEHSIQVRDAFLSKGVAAEHVDANIPDHERDAMIARLESGETKVICSIGTMTTGVDIPSLGCIVFARPTKSYILYVQMLGRGTRPFPGKNHFLVLDHAGNVMKHGDLKHVDSVTPTLDGKEPSDKPPPIMTCPSCYFIYPMKPGPCPACGHVKVVEEKSRYQERDGELEEYNHDPIMLKVFKLRQMRKEKRYHVNWVWHKLKEEFGEEIANKYHPIYKVPSWA